MFFFTLDAPKIYRFNEVFQKDCFSSKWLYSFYLIESAPGNICSICLYLDRIYLTTFKSKICLYIEYCHICPGISDAYLVIVDKSKRSDCSVLCPEFQLFSHRCNIVPRAFATNISMVIILMGFCTLTLKFRHSNI